MAKNEKLQTTASPEEIAATLAQAKDGPPEGFTPVSFGPALAKEGDVVCGEYIGPGEQKEVKRGKKRDLVNMYRLKDDKRGIIEIMGGAQIDALFSTLSPGRRVWIRRDGQGKTSEGNKVNLYSFAVQG